MMEIRYVAPRRHESNLKLVIRGPLGSRPLKSSWYRFESVYILTDPWITD